MQTKLFRRDFTLVVIGQIISLFWQCHLAFCLTAVFIAGNRFFHVVWHCDCLFICSYGILSMAGEVLADRVNKRNIMVGLDLLYGSHLSCFFTFRWERCTNGSAFYRCFNATLWYIRHIPASSTGKRSTAGSKRQN